MHIIAAWTKVLETVKSMIFAGRIDTKISCWKGRGTYLLVDKFLILLVSNFVQLGCCFTLEHAKKLWENNYNIRLSSR